MRLVAAYFNSNMACSNSFGCKTGFLDSQKCVSKLHMGCAVGKSLLPQCEYRETLLLSPLSFIIRKDRYILVHGIHKWLALLINDLPSSASFIIHSFADETYVSSSFLFDSHDHGRADIPLHGNISASLLTNDFTVVEKWGEDSLVSFNQSHTTQAVILRKLNPDFHLFSW